MNKTNLFQITLLMGLLITGTACEEKPVTPIQTPDTTQESSGDDAVCTDPDSGAGGQCLDYHPAGMGGYGGSPAGEVKPP